MKSIILRVILDYIKLCNIIDIGVYFLELLELTSTDRSLEEGRKVFSAIVYNSCIVSFISIYIVRIIFAAIRMFVGKM